MSSVKERANKEEAHLTFTSPKSTTETLEKGVKYFHTFF